MKKLVVLLFAVVALTIGSGFAQVNEDGILVVPMTSVKPTIDGTLDDVWKYVGETLCIIRDAGDAADPDDWFDLFGSLRLMFDNDNLYLWLWVHDELINPGTDWQYDGVELYFDADNSKTDGAYDGIDDVQIRFNVGETTNDLIDVGYGTSSGWGYNKDDVEFYIGETDIGWVLEAAMPLTDLQLAAGSEFGFDCQINDADESTRSNMYRWWSNNNDEWRNASLFGTAYLENKRVVNADFLEVPKGTAPTIDGKMNAGEWKDAVQLCSNMLDNGQNIGFINGWEDTRSWGYLKHDATNLYLYFVMWDEYYDYAPDEGSNWEFDSMELYFDGDNSKTDGAYDGVDDIQIRFNLGQEGTESIDVGYGTGSSWNWDKSTTQYVAAETELGWDLEIAIPLAEMQIPVGQDFGFDWQLNDCDDPGEDQNRTVYRWWAPGEPEWSNASMFGTAVLSKGQGVADKPVKVNSYDLGQNYPNPFNPTTTISYSVAKTGNVELKVYDLTGKEVATLVNEVKPAGQYTVTFNGSDLTSGVYLYTLKSGDQTFTKKMSLVK